MTRIRTAIELAKRSVAVLAADRHLVVFPVLGGVLSIVVAGGFGVIGFAVPGAVDPSDDSARLIGPLVWVLILAYYFVQAFIATYFLAALVAAAMRSLRGEPASIGEAFAAANRRLGPIVLWSLLTGTVSVVLSLIRERAGFVGAIVAGLIGGAWEILTFLTVPIIVEEGTGPIRSLKRSGTLFRQTWGENLSAQIGFGLLAFVAFLPAILAISLVALTGELALIVPVAIVAFVWILAASVVFATLSGIYRAALYRYAVDGEVPSAFAGVDFAHAFAPRAARFGR